MTIYTGRVTNWALFWATTALYAALLVAMAFAAKPIWVLAPLAGVLVLASLMMTSLRTTCGPAGVVARFGVFGVPWMRYRADRIATVQAVVVPVRRLGGYGIHWSPWRGTRITIRSGPALVLTLVNGRRVTITVADPAAAVAALGSDNQAVRR